MNRSQSRYAYRWRLDGVTFLTRLATGYVLVLLVIVITPDFSFGEERGRVRPNPQRVMEQLARQLNLTAPQIAAMTPIIADEGNKRRLLMDKLRAEVEQLEQETSGRLAKVLSPEQMAQFNKMLEERRSRGGEKQLPPPRQEGVPPRPPEEGGRPRLDQ